MQSALERNRSYLYVPGKYGIHPELLEKGMGEHVIRAESGRDLIFIKGVSRLALYDPTIHNPANANLHQGILDSYINGESLHFIIYPNEPFLHIFQRKIPDLNPSGFFDFALEHFSIHNGNFKQIEASWHKDNGVTYAQYKKALKRTGDKVLAAYSTWTGKQARRNGFTTTPEDIEEVLFADEEAVLFSEPVPIVSAIFRHPK